MSLQKSLLSFINEIDDCEFSLRMLERRSKSLTQFVYTASFPYKENMDDENTQR